MRSQPNSQISRCQRAAIAEDIRRNLRERFPNSRVISHRVAKIANKGPANEADFTGKPYYWIQFQRIQIATDGTVTFIDETAPGLGGIVEATNLSEAATSHAIATDGTVYVDARLVDHRTVPPVRRWYFGTGGSGGTKIVRVTSAYSGPGFYSAQITKRIPPKEWIPIIASGADTQTKYTTGAAFANNDYAKNLADGVVYHRTGGAWVAAPGHLSDTDWDVTTTLSDVQSTFRINDPAEAPIILLNNYETGGNDHQLDTFQPLVVGALYTAEYESTQSNGDRVYATDGSFKFQDPIEDGNLIIAWDGNWQRDHERMTAT